MRDWVQHMADCKQAAFERAQRGLGGGAGTIRKPSDYAPVDDDFDYALELADCYLREAIGALRERRAIGVDLLDTF